MKDKDLPYSKRVRAAFFNRHETTQIRCKIDADHCKRVITLMGTLPEPHQRDFIRLQFKVYGLKEVRLQAEQSP